MQPVPETEYRDKIGSQGLDRVVFNEIVFYKSGPAEVVFREDHNGDRFGLTHNYLQLPDDAYQTWSAPVFTGPVVINLKSILTDNSPFPNREFIFDIIPEQGQLIAIPDSRAQFRAPSAFVTLE